MIEDNFTDRSFNKDSSKSYNLSIQVNRGGMTYAIFDHSSGQCIHVKKDRFDKVWLDKDIVEKTSEILESDELLSLEFHTVKVIGYTQLSTLVPAVFFDKNRQEDYLTFNTGSTVDHDVYYNHILSPLDAYNVFALPSDLTALFSVHFDKVGFLSQTAPFLNHIVFGPDSLDRDAVYVGLHPDFFDLAVAGKGQLRLYNTFQYASEHDLLYYIAYAYRQTGFEPGIVPLYLSGERSSRILYKETLKQLIVNLKENQVTDLPALAPGLKQLQTVRYINLLKSNTCGSSVEHSKAEI
jgi:hypothetical protein